jgi:lipopolysaccharide transport system permease protein
MTYWAAMGATDGFVLTAAPTRPATLVREIWGSRQLIGMLARKDFFVRYRRASLGVLWAVAVPLLQAAVLAVVFSRIVGDQVNTRGSYAAFVIVGTLGWSLFAGIVNSCSTSIVDNSTLTSKIYFPRATPVIAGTLTSLYSSVVGVVFMIPAVVLAALLGGAFALVFSALHVYFRDMRYLVAAVVQPWFYATPVLYPIGLVPGWVRPVMIANPATGVVELFRAGTVGADAGWLGMVAVTCAWAVGLAIFALYLHCRYNRVFCDLL